MYMSLSLNSLKASLGKITNLGYIERNINVGDNKITLRSLKPKEEIELQKIIADLSKNQEITTLEFVDVIRRETLSRAIIQINDIKLTDEDLIETGELLPNGVPVKINKIEAVATIIDEFPRLVLSKIFEEMNSLIEEAENRTNTILKVSQENIDAEIEVLESRIKHLKFTKESIALDTRVTNNSAVSAALNQKEPSFSEKLRNIE